MGCPCYNLPTAENPSAADQVSENECHDEEDAVSASSDQSEGVGALADCDPCGSNGGTNSAGHAGAFLPSRGKPLTSF